MAPVQKQVTIKYSGSPHMKLGENGGPVLYFTLSEN
jgi:hypothetical protein